ncbi:MAG: hypothetical protein J2P38_04470, partial [Candidatus Dormibacteraeota bacterium]|nr:hypothetical protein [Candidatus Dormibacteraeota bacterium]
MPATVTIPGRSTVDAVFVVFFAPTGDEPPAAGALRPLVTEWRDQHLRDPLRAAVATLQDRGVTSLRVERVADLPRPPVELLRYMGLGELEERILGAATHAVVVGCPDLNVAPRIG